MSIPVSDSGHSRHERWLDLTSLRREACSSKLSTVTSRSLIHFLWTVKIILPGKRPLSRQSIARGASSKSNFIAIMSSKWRSRASMNAHISSRSRLGPMLIHARLIMTVRSIKDGRNSSSLSTCVSPNSKCCSPALGVLSLPDSAKDILLRS